MSISARMHFFPPFAGHASFRELSKLWQEVFFKLDLGWLAGALLSTLIKLPAVYLKIFKGLSDQSNACSNQKIKLQEKHLSILLPSP